MKNRLYEIFKKTVSILLLAAFAVSAVPANLAAYAANESAGGAASYTENYKSKVISVLGDSISTFAGYIPTADGYNLEHLARYPQEDLLTDVNETWWMQFITRLDAKLGINDSWRGATASGAHPVTTGATGEDAAMFNLQRVKNLGANGTPDVIVFYGGTNDYAHVAALGSFDASTAPSEPDLSAVKYDNLADGYVETLLRLKYFYPGALVIALLPAPTKSYYSNSKLTQGNALLAEICDHYGVPYVDLDQAGVTADMLPDGIHPDASGMDVITDALIGLAGTVPITAGENKVYPVSHILTGAKASLSYYKGVSEGKRFSETVSGKDVTVSVLMGGEDITADCYENGIINIPAVTGELVITATGTNGIIGGHLAALPVDICSGLNIWSVLPHDPQYYSPSQGWGKTTVPAPSVTFEIEPGEKIYASSFGKIHENGSEKHDGIRVTFFDGSGVLVSLDPSRVYAEFEQNGYLTAPDGARYVNVPMWGDSDQWELYLLGRDHLLENGSYGVCRVCGSFIKMRYDDRLDMSGKTVSVIDAGTPTSYKVGYGVEENTTDDAVVKYENGKLIACGTGEAAVMIDGVLYRVNVEPAPLSLLLLIGQSNMRGSEGNADQSIVCPEGQVYATYGDDRGASNIAMTTETARLFAPSALAGDHSGINVEGTTEGISGYPVRSLTERGDGKIGPDSGFAYEWVKQTGEKVWVVNAAHGGTGISLWQKGKSEYEEALLLFTACRETLRHEIAAGHYTLSHMGYFWCQGCQDSSCTAEWYVNKFLSMHNNLKKDHTFDHDLDPSTPDITFEFAGIIPILYGVNSYREGVYADPQSGSYYESFRLLTFNGPRAAQYWMCNNPDLNDIWLVCNIGESWVKMPDGTNGVKAYFNSRYPDGTVDYTTQKEQTASWYKPTTPAAVHDSIHYNQIGYNEIGRESVRNALIMLGELQAPDVDPTVRFLSWDGYTEVTEISASTVANSGTLVVPVVYPVWKSKQVTYELTEGLNYNYYDLLAENDTTYGTVTATDAEGDSVIITVHYIHYHDWSEWETVSEPDRYGPGEKERVCKGCGLTEKQTVYSIWQTTNIAEHYNDLPEHVCRDLNLWSVLEHDDKYYVVSKGDWDYHSSHNVPSVTFAINPGDMIYATSFGAAGSNGSTTANGIRLTFFDINGVLKTTDPSGTYSEFTANGGYVIAPEGAIAVNIAMWNNSDANEIYILNRAHPFGKWETVKEGSCEEDGMIQRVCPACGKTETETVPAPGHDYVNCVCTRCGDSYTAGEANGDGKLNNKDVAIIFRYVTNNPEPDYVIAYDFNFDGAVDNKDVAALFRYVSSG